MVYCNKESDVADLNGIFEATKDLLNVNNKNLIVNLNIVSDKEIHRINKQYRGVDRPTDVLSFPLLEGNFTNEANPFDVDPITNELCLGDIYICDSIARIQAQEYGHSFRREFCYLFVHGLLHLFGYDHLEEQEKTVMRAQEELIMNKLNITRDGD